MKKITIISILINLFLIIVCFFWYLKSTDLKKELELLKREKKDYGKESQFKEVIDKNDPVYIFNTKKFPCDSGYSSYESNLCIGEKLNFADSLLNKLVKNKLTTLDKYIQINKEGIVKAKGNPFFTKALKSNRYKKEKLIRSQKLWNEIRALNAEDAWLTCEGATGCPGYVSKVEIECVLARIEELKGLDVYN